MPGAVPPSYVNSLASFGGESPANKAKLIATRDACYAQISLGNGQLLSGTINGNTGAQQFGLTYQEDFDAHQSALDRLNRRRFTRTQGRVR